VTKSKSPREKGTYERIIVHLFNRHWRAGITEFVVSRNEIREAAEELGLAAPRNLGDLIYTYRYRRDFPDEILATEPPGRHWLILGAGDASYRFRLNRLVRIKPQEGLHIRKIPHSTPEIIESYALSDEQALLARIRYNRLIDIFLGVTAYSLQNHLRTKIDNYGQIEIDELYVGVDSGGAHHVIPVQAKGKSDKLGVIQTIQDHMYCSGNPRYAGCVVRNVSAQFLPDGTIALFELRFDGDEVTILRERHYQLVPENEITLADKESYRED